MKGKKKATNTKHTASTIIHKVQRNGKENEFNRLTVLRKLKGFRKGNQRYVFYVRIQCKQENNKLI